jgi:hypothetical protein
MLVSSCNLSQTVPIGDQFFLHMVPEQDAMKAGLAIKDPPKKTRNPLKKKPIKMFFYVF